MGSHKVVGKKHQVVTAPYGPNGAMNSVPIVAKSCSSVDNSTSLQPSGFLLFKQPAEPIKDKPSIHGHLTRSRKQPREKQADELLAIKHTCMHGLFIGVAIEWWQNLCIEVALLVNLVT